MSCGKDDNPLLPQEDGSAIEISIVAPPNPNVFPVFVMMQNNPEFNINLLAVSSGGEVPPSFQSGEADVATIYTYVMAKHYITGAIPDLELKAVTLWDNFYIVSKAEFDTWESLMGKTIIVTGPGGTGQNGAPDFILQAALRKEGFALTDFNIEYLQMEEGMQKVLEQEAQAILFAEPAASGFVTNALMSGVTLSKTLNLQLSFNGYNSWTSGKIPLGGIGIRSSYDTSEKEEAVDAFVEAYKEAANYIRDNKNAASRIISNGLSQYYSQAFPFPIISRSLSGGSLDFDGNYGINEIKTDLDTFILEVYGSSPGNDFYSN